ncbi:MULTISPECIES: sugar phosphate isomerase/epimerase family protein [unclassified Paenibacillus]|uniref:sugar phosphate isomerase/epimerase family protein n=1 Tax=unclassified Paenibacillus TaxID=185978 RepID=UPI00362DAEF9
MKLGFSLQSLAFFGGAGKNSSSEWIAHYESIELFLDVLKASGITSIELRYLPRSGNPRVYREIIELIWGMGLVLTVQGEVAGTARGSCFAEIYPSMSFILNHFHKYQSTLLMTLPLVDAWAAKVSNAEWHEQTVRLLRHWTEIVTAEELPITFALENSKLSSDGSIPGCPLERMLRIVEDIESPSVGICWDLGAYYAEQLRISGHAHPIERYGGELPSPSFIKRVSHTHLHGVASNGIHNPLIEKASLPLETYTDVLRTSGYEGIYNLELTMDKCSGMFEPCDLIFGSIRRVKQAHIRPSKSYRGM